MGDMMTRWQGMVMSAPHKATASGNNLSLAIAAPKIERLVVNIQPVQSGSGTPSPSNVRPISGHSTVNVTIGADSRTMTLGGTYYGGTLDMLTGVLTVTYGAMTVGSATAINGNTAGDFLYINMGNTLPFKHSTTAPHPIAYCDKLEIVTTRPRTRTTTGLGEYDGGTYYSYIYVWDIAKTITTATTKAKAIAALREIAPTWVFEIQNPQTYQLDPQTVRALTGQQTVSTDAGSIDITYYTV